MSKFRVSWIVRSRFDSTSKHRLFVGREPDSWVLLHDNASVHYAAVVTAFLHKNKLQRCTVVAKFNTVLLLFVSTVRIKDGRKALCHDVSTCKRQ